MRAVEFVRRPARRGPHRGHDGQHPLLVLLPRCDDLARGSDSHGSRRGTRAGGREEVCLGFRALR